MPKAKDFENPDPKKVLQAIAWGYKVAVEHDRYVIVDNPDYNNPWDDPTICYDCWEGEYDEEDDEEEEIREC